MLQALAVVLTFHSIADVVADPCDAVEQLGIGNPLNSSFLPFPVCKILGLAMSTYYQSQSQ